MALNNNLPYRQSFRMHDYDYRRQGAYFITICTFNRELLFGEIKEGVMHLNAAGRIVQSVWDEIPTFYAGIKIDEFIVMPDHVHGIIQIVGAAPVAAPTCLSLSDAVHRSKSLSTNRYGNGVISQGWPPYSGRLWHRNYWERIIRQDSEYQAICQYIQQNPVHYKK